MQLLNRLTIGARDDGGLVGIREPREEGFEEGDAGGAWVGEAGMAVPFA